MKLRAETVKVCTTGEDRSNACKDGKRAVVEAPN